MKKVIILFALIFSLFYACTEDTSAYLPQDKEQIKVDDVLIEGDGETQEPQEGELIPGIHLIKVQVTEPGGEVVERRFKYFMPISVNTSQPISLIFEFHGSYSFEAGGEPVDPIGSISTSHALIQHAIKENCIIVFPAGEVLRESGSVNWSNSEKNLPFFDRMVEYFNRSTPRVDPNRIFSTGQSSGAIFSFVLAYTRSSVVAAIAPRAGQMRIEGSTDLPERAVPVRVFAGTNDNTVIHSAVLSNMEDWAEMIGGYFSSDMVLTENAFAIENYMEVTTRTWNGGKADTEIYSLINEGHGISLYYCLPYIWDFFSSHPLNLASGGCFVTAQKRELVAQCGEKIEIPFNHTDGATPELVNAPADWSPRIEGKTIKLTAPGDYFGNVHRNGSFDLSVSFNGSKASLTINYELTPPKAYFEVGDIYYNDAFDPVGVVCWVNNANIREAKILCLEEVPGYGTVKYGNFGYFETPDRHDGEGNTAAAMQWKEDQQLNLTENNSVIVYAATYAYGGVGNWYLPAVEEWIAVNANLAVINAALKSVGAPAFEPTSQALGGYHSSTVLFSTSPNKVFKYFNFYTKTELEQTGTDTSYFRARLMKKVSK